MFKVVSRGRGLLREMTTAEVPALPKAEAQAGVICLAVLSGPSSGEVIEVRDGMIIGRGPRADVRPSDYGISREHVRVTICDDRAIRVTDLRSSNGTYVRGNPVDSEVLRDGDRFTIGRSTFLVFTHDAAGSDYQRRGAGRAWETRDPLTGLYTRRFFLERLQDELEICRRRQQPLVILLFEIDRLEVPRLEDVKAMDDCVSSIARRITRCVRIEDLTARYDLFRFAVLCARIRVATGKQISSRVLAAVGRAPPVRGAPGVRASLKAGLAAARPHDDPSPTSLMRRAEQALRRPSSRSIPGSVGDGFRARHG